MDFSCEKWYNKDKIVAFSIIYSIAVDIGGKTKNLINIRREVLNIYGYCQKKNTENKYMEFKARF